MHVSVRRERSSDLFRMNMHPTFVAGVPFKTGPCWITSLLNELAATTATIYPPTRAGPGRERGRHACMRPQNNATPTVQGHTMHCKIATAAAACLCRLPSLAENIHACAILCLTGYSQPPVIDRYDRPRTASLIYVASGKTGETTS